MFPFLKKKATAQEVAECLLHLALGEDQPTSDSVDKFVKGSAVDRELLQRELQYLRAFGADFATTQALGYTPEKNAVLDVFYGAIAAMPADEEDDTTAFIEGLRARVQVYGEAIQTPHANGHVWMVGKTFAELCDEKMNLDVMMVGMTDFSTLCNAIEELIGGIRIVL